MNAMETTLHLRFRVATYLVMVRCAIPKDSFYHFYHLEIFPSFDESSSEFNEVSPNYCKYYRAIPKDGGCQFTTEVLSCHHGSEFAYSPFEMSSTLAMDNDLVCQDFYWTIIIDEFFMVGLMVGSSLFGVMADRIGRRHTIVITLLCCALGISNNCVNICLCLS